jgi:XTP/dITP diphosphohydrolase
VPTAASPSSRRLVIASLNRAKVRELTELLGALPYVVVALADVPGATLPEETADSYEGNALLKARAVAVRDGDVVLADDSGLEVDALGGAPGVRSARFGGPALDDAGRTALLLEQLRGVPQERRTARFRCVIAIAGGSGQARTVEGVVEGVIADAPRGGGGFGYDPVFLHPPSGKTFGELSEAEKSRVSHRALAALRARALLVG